MKGVPLFYGRCPLCGDSPTVADVRRATGCTPLAHWHDAMKYGAAKIRCESCRGVIDLRKNGRGSRSRERVPVIRSVSSSGVSYRFFGESYGLTQNGVNVAAVQGFKGTGAGLSQKLNVPAADLAKTLNLPLEEFLKTSFDVSKD